MRDQLITDLATAVAKPPTKPTTAGQVRRSSGTLLTWDPSELRGSVDWNGTILSDVPLLGATDAFGWQAGDEVVIDTIPGTSGGFSSPMILGRVFRPGAANAATVLQGSQNEFAKQNSVEIFADRVHAASGDFVGNVTSATFADPPSGDPRPVISDVQVSTGVCIVWLSPGFAIQNYSGGGGAGVGFGDASFEISGATSMAPDDDRMAFFGRSSSPDTTTSYPQYNSRLCNVVVVTGLNAGLHTFTMKYRNTAATSVNFSLPTLVVMAF